MDGNSATGFRYDELAAILAACHFVLVGKSGSHRTWRRSIPGGNVLRITLVDKGSGEIGQAYVRAMRHLLNSDSAIRTEIDTHGTVD